MSTFTHIAKADGKTFCGRKVSDCKCVDPDKHNCTFCTRVWNKLSPKKRESLRAGS